MIKTKPRPETPATLGSRKVSNRKHALSQKANNGERILSSDFSSYSYWTEPDIKEALWDMHCGKCCYCERKRDMKRESDVEHFRPKSEVAGEDHPGYWWLAYEWDNYLLSCKTCNQTYKKCHFPLIPGSPRAQGPNDDLNSEKPVLIDPAKEDPERFIGFYWSNAIFVKAIGLDDDLRGYETVKLLGLNKGTLPEQRAEIIDELLDIAKLYFHAKLSNNTELFEEMKNKIKWATSAEREFAGFRRAFFKNLRLYMDISNN